MGKSPRTKGTEQTANPSLFFSAVALNLSIYCALGGVHTYIVSNPHNPGTGRILLVGSSMWAKIQTISQAFSASGFELGSYWHQNPIFPKQASLTFQVEVRHWTLKAGGFFRLEGRERKWHIHLKGPNLPSFFPLACNFSVKRTTLGRHTTSREHFQEEAKGSKIWAESRNRFKKINVLLYRLRVCSFKLSTMSFQIHKFSCYY